MAGASDGPLDSRCSQPARMPLQAASANNVFLIMVLLHQGTISFEEEKRHCCDFLAN
jgi:hypothetical protein